MIPSGCFHHLHCIDVELIVHNLVSLCQSLLDQPISTNVVCLKESLQVVILKTSLVTFRFLIVVSTEIAWAAILLKTLFSTVSLALLVSLHYSQISGCPPVSDFWKKLEFCHNRLTPQPWLRKYIIVYFAF